MKYAWLMFVIGCSTSTPNMMDGGTTMKDAMAMNDVAVVQDASKESEAGPDTCEDYCSNIAFSCMDAKEQYAGQTVCLAECQGLGDGLACRANALRQDAACNVAGPTGGGVCGTRCDAFCKLVFHVCKPENHFAMNPYGSMNDCMNACNAFTFDPKAPEFDVGRKDTLNCRQYHLQAAFFDFAGGTAHDECPNLAIASPACSPADM